MSQFDKRDAIMDLCCRCADDACVTALERRLTSRVALYPPLTALGEDGLQVAFKERAGVLEVLFGVGFGGGDALKRFVEDADDPLLFGERWEWESACSVNSPS